MSELSAAEKRRILREKRANKLANGGDRINKILGSDSTGVEKNETSTTSNLTSTKKSNRISTILQPEEETEFDDPPVSGLGDESIESDSPLNEFVSNEEIEQALNKMLRSSAGDGHNHNQPIDTDALSSMLNMNGLGMGNLGNLGGLGGMQGMGMGGDMPAVKSEYDILKSKFYQSTYAVIRFICILTMVLMDERDTRLLWNKFLMLEVVLGGIQLLCCVYGIFPSNTIMSFDITSFGSVNSVINGYAVARSFFNDFCFYILVFVSLNKF